MIYNSKGLSTIVTTLIIILLSLVAIGIIWVVVSNVLESGAGQSEINAKCLQVDVRATAASCTGGGCNVTYARRSGGDDIDGLKIILSNGIETVPAFDVSTNVAPLATATATGIAESLTPDPNSVQVAAYFVDASGNEQLCSPSGALEF